LAGCEQNTKLPNLLPNCACGHAPRTKSDGSLLKAKGLGSRCARGRDGYLPGMADDDQLRSGNLERMRESVDRKAEEARAKAEEDSLAGRDRPQDESDVRAKSSGHKKKTADKWNQ